MATNLLIKKAEKKNVKIRLALTGPSGSGKTLSSLILANSLGKKILVLDTENESASLYSDKFDFDTVVMNPPFLISKYLQVFEEAESLNYDVLVVDSLTHAWAGEGGVLDRKAAVDSRGGNTYTNWNSFTPEQERLKSAIVQSKIHIVCTMRSKQDYVMQQNDKGKMAPVKVGLNPIQRDGMEYEFTTVFDLGMDHQYQVSKDRTNLFDGEIARITKATGERLLSWAKESKKENDEEKKEDSVLNENGEPIKYAKKLNGNGSDKELTTNLDRMLLTKLKDHGKANGYKVDEMTKIIKASTGKDWKDLTETEYNAVWKLVDKGVRVAPDGSLYE